MESLKNGLAIGFFVAGFLCFFFPEFNGIFSDPIKINIAEGRLMGLVAMIGGAILFFMPTNKK